jgi:DNA mismatch repair protein MutS
MDADAADPDADGGAVTGPPAKMAAHREELTPMMSQYFDLCAAYDDALVLFQVGDFYETFCEAAAETARLLELTLTQREDSTGTYPMTGIPIDNATGYVETLLDAGYRVAVADQVEEAAEASGLVDRAVTRVVTPGTVVDDDLLEAGAVNYVAAVARGGGGDGDAGGERRYGVAAVDVATGECTVTGVTGRDRAVDELERVDPAELLVGPRVGDVDVEGDPMRTDHESASFEREDARERVAAYAPSPDAVVESDAELRAVGAALGYAEYTQGDDGPLEYVARVSRYDPERSLRLDATATRSLELFEGRGPGDGTALFDVLDRTASAPGRRTLERWLRRPLVERDRIERRLDAVEELLERGVVRETLRERLRDVYDVERLIGRVSRGRANARDLRSLKESLDAVPDLREALGEAECDPLRDLRERLDELADVRELVGEAIHPDPPMEVTDGGVIREGFDDELDDLRSTEREGREWVADLEARERERTGIDSLEVGHNAVHGYYIEVTDPNLDAVPEEYTRRQTLKNAERFYTPELKRREDEILGAADRADALEYDLFCETRSAVGAEADRVQALADALAELDALAALSAVASENGYVRPRFHDGGIEIAGGRHPVVERTRAEFVPNDADLTDTTVAVVTGPNMSGKSTYMRQVALICVLAQTGSFVPADAARLPVLDRVFTRVGASDDIAGGQSTFMREMAELTEVLHGATEASLVLLDEVGRGTSTADGLAIAWATAEFVDREVGATTLFATHYHELTALADEREAVENRHFSARREDGDVTFLHRVESGAASSSYGVEVARMAGVPERVVERSRELVDRGVPPSRDQQTPTAFSAGAEGADAATGDGPAANGRAAGDEPAADAGDDPTVAAGDETGPDDRPDDEAAVLEALREVDVADTTPLQALNELNDLQRRLDDG